MGTVDGRGVRRVFGHRACGAIHGFGGPLFGFREVRLHQQSAFASVLGVRQRREKEQDEERRHPCQLPPRPSQQPQRQRRRHHHERE